jgi:hypothetical protein
VVGLELFLRDTVWRSVIARLRGASGLAITYLTFDHSLLCTLQTAGVCSGVGICGIDRAVGVSWEDRVVRGHGIRHGLLLLFEIVRCDLL